MYINEANNTYHNSGENILKKQLCKRDYVRELSYHDKIYLSLL